MTRKSQTALDRAKNQLRGSPNPIAKLEELRHTLRTADLIKLVEWAPNYYRNGRGLFRSQFPRNVSELGQQGVFSAIPAGREIIWACRRLLHHSEKINSFRVIAERYEKELTLHNLQRCKALVEEIEKIFGVSQWLIENRIAILQLLEGIEAQKAYAASVREARGAHDLVSYLAFCISYRNENAVTVPHYTNQITAAVDPERGISPELATYVLYRATNRPPQLDNEVGALLRYDDNSSIIDLYETFLQLAKWSIPCSEYDLKDCFLAELKILITKIHDYRINKLLFAGGVTGDLPNMSSVHVGIHNSFVAGRYEEAITRAIQDDSINPNAWLVEAKARSENSLAPREEDSRLATTVVNLARSIILRNQDAEDSLAKLSKIRLNFRLLNFSSALQPFLAEASSSDPIPLGTPDQVVAFIDDPVMGPDAYHCLPSHELRNVYGRRVMSVSEHCPSLYFHIMRSGDPLPAGFPPEITGEIHEETLIEMNAERHLRLGHYSETLSISAKLADSKKHTTRTKAVQFRAHALLKSRQIPELTEFIVASALEDKGMIRNLPVRECAQALNKPMRKQLRAYLSTSILLDLYSRNVDDSLDSERSFAYEDFLISHGIKKPSELAAKLKDFPIHQVRYYFRYICIPSVMERSTVFGGTREVEDERLKVLSLLVNLDPADSSHYSAEISGINRNNKIRQGVKRVEQSKISIDVPALRRWAHLNIKESFNRYKTFLTAGLHAEAASAADVVGASNTTQVQTRDKDALDVPANEIVDVLSKMIYAMFSEFTTNPEHGLDCYLSIRIRHGPLSGQLRSPLETEEIISQRENDSSTYNSHPSWMKRLNHLEWLQRNDVVDRLKLFSREYDDFINRIANDLIQVKTKDKKDGLFVITEEVGGRAQIKGIGIPRFAAFITAMDEDTTFDTFLDNSFELFWESVEQSLKTIRALIDTSMKGELALLFTRLENDIAQIAGDGATPDLDRSIRVAKTNAQEALERVKEWFRLSEPLTTPELAFQDLVDIGLQSVKTMHPEFEPIITMDIPELPLLEGVLDKIFDIFQLIFDNIRKHSGVGKSPSVSLKLIHTGERLKVTIENEVASSVRKPETEARLQSIKQSIAEGMYQSGVRLEGGSGLFKLRARVGSTEGRPLPLDFGFTPEGWFFVQFEVAIRRIGEGTE